MCGMLKYRYTIYSNNDLNRLCNAVLVQQHHPVEQVTDKVLSHPEVIY
jgi:hypothetical protein